MNLRTSNRVGKILRRSRIVLQLLFLILFFYLFFYFSGSTKVFFNFDPLILIINLIATGTIITAFLLSLITLFLTLFFGRFFCGWICPFGAINQFFTWIFRKKRKKRENPEQGYLKIKYFVLIALVISALMGTQLVGWLDPFSLLTRSAATFSAPINYLLDHTISAGAEAAGAISKDSKPFFDATKKFIISENPHYSAQSILIPLLFIIFILLNYYKRRFFCNTLCPLGALLGLVSRIGFFKMTTTSSCNSCGACSRSCTYYGKPDSGFLKSECLACFNCVTDCPSEAVAVEVIASPKEKSAKVDLGRRNVIGAVFSGLVIASLPKISIQASKKARHPFTRPPGSVNEKEFLEKCVRCGNCVQSCPTSFIQPAFMQAGVEAIWTPILNAQVGSCTYDCNKCTQVCSTQSIQKLTLKEKQKFKIGTAVVDKNRCYTYADGFNCSVCFDHCPIPEKAIRFHEVETWSFQGRNTTVKQIYVVPDLCIGCGICENVCPRKDSPGIFNTSEDEVRESITGDV